MCGSSFFGVYIYCKTDYFGFQEAGLCEKFKNNLKKN